MRLLVGGIWDYQDLMRFCFLFFFFSFGSFGSACMTHDGEKYLNHGIGSSGRREDFWEH